MAPTPSSLFLTPTLDSVAAAHAGLSTADDAPPRRSRRLAFALTTLLLGLLGCAAMQYAVFSGAWQVFYARRVMPDVIVEPNGDLCTPPSATVRNGYIAEFRPPPG